MITRRFLWLTGTLSVVVGSAAAAQSPQLVTGDWVRISTQTFDADPAWRVGALAAVTDRYVIIAPIGEGPLAIPHRTLTRFQYQRGWKSHWKRGSLIGGLGGVAVSALLLALTDCGPVCLAAVPLGFAGGGVMGARQSSIDWRAIPPSRVRPHNIAADWPRRLRLVRVTF